MVRYTTGETFQDRSKGKDVRTSNIVAAKVCDKFDQRTHSLYAVQFALTFVTF